MQEGRPIKHQPIMDKVWVPLKKTSGPHAQEQTHHLQSDSGPFYHWCPPRWPSTSAVTRGLGCIKVGCKIMQNLPPSLLQEFHNGSCNPASKKTSLDIVEQGRSKLHTNYFLNKQSGWSPANSWNLDIKPLNCHPSSLLSNPFSKWKPRHLVLSGLLGLRSWKPRSNEGVGQETQELRRV